MAARQNNPIQRRIPRLHDILPPSAFNTLLKLSHGIGASNLRSIVRYVYEQDEYNHGMEESVCAYIMKRLKPTIFLNKWTMEDEPNIKIRYWMQVWVLSEDEFWKTFHVNKNTFYFVLENIQTESLEMDESTDAGTFEEYVIKTVLLCLWYLRHDAPVTLCCEVFCIPLEKIDDELAKGFALINDINVPIVSVESLNENRQFYRERHHLPVVGVLGHELFKSKDKQEVMVHMICNQNNQFLAVDSCHHRKICQGLMGSKKIQKVLQLIPEDSYVAGYGTYEKYPQSGKHVKILIPLINDGSMAHKVFNQTIKRVFAMITKSVVKVVDRFPIIPKMHKRIPGGVLAGFTLHNICLFTNDEASVV